MSNTKSALMKLIALTLLIFSFTTLGAQVELGLTGGYVKAWEEYQRDDLPEDANIHVEGFRIGITAYTPLNHFLSLGAEPN